MSWFKKTVKKVYHAPSTFVRNVKANPMQTLEGAALGYLTGGAYNLATTGSAGTGIGIVGGGAGQVSGMQAATIGAVAATGKAAGLPALQPPEDVPTDATADDNQGDPVLIAREQAKRRAALLANGRRSTFLTGPGGTLGQGQSMAMNQLFGG